MSSAILYLAIIAIWAGVLIPRLLKRDTSQAAKSSGEHTDDQPADADQDAHADGADEDMTESNADAGLIAADSGGPDDVRGYQPERGRTPAATLPGHRETRTRIVSARRRMLIILCTLTVAAMGLAMTRLAAWWVAVPPVIMLGVYLRLLRESSRADAEHALLEAAAYREEQERRYARATAQLAAPSPAPPPTARVIDISGRVRDEPYDQYADGERRAVGD